MESPVNCSCCKNHCVRNGKSKKGTQRYYCRSCRKSFQQGYVYQACQQGINRWIVLLTRESCGIRSIARLLRISVSTVISRIKAYSKTLSRPFPILKNKVYEMDEMRTYIGNKKRLYWIVYAIQRDTKQVIDFKVGRRTTRTLQKVADTLILSDAKQIFTDGYALYRNILPKRIHHSSAFNTNQIERKNLSVRTHLKRLSRRTLCFSRSAVMLEACLRIYFWCPLKF